MKEGAIQGRLDLHFLDESGFAPTLPTTYTVPTASVQRMPAPIVRTRAITR